MRADGWWRRPMTRSSSFVVSRRLTAGIGRCSITRISVFWTSAAVPAPHPAVLSALGSHFPHCVLLWSLCGRMEERGRVARKVTIRAGEKRRMRLEEEDKTLAIRLRVTRKHPSGHLKGDFAEIRIISRCGRSSRNVQLP